VIPVHPVGDPLADCVEFDPGADGVRAVCRLPRPVFFQRYEFRLQRLDLQGYGKAVRGFAAAQTDETLAGFQHYVAGLSLSTFSL
jgi:hypothetical protein